MTSNSLTQRMRDAAEVLLEVSRSLRPIDPRFSDESEDVTWSYRTLCAQANVWDQEAEIRALSEALSRGTHLWQDFTPHVARYLIANGWHR